MTSDKWVALFIIAALIGVVVIAAVVRRRRQHREAARLISPAVQSPFPRAAVPPPVPMNKWPSSLTPGQRLLAHARDRDDYEMFVGLPATQPNE